MRWDAFVEACPEIASLAGERFGSDAAAKKRTAERLERERAARRRKKTR